MQEFLYRLQLVRRDLLRTGPTDSEQAVVAEHFAYLQGLHAQGVIILVGRTLNTDDSAMGSPSSTPNPKTPLARSWTVIQLYRRG
jgi:hypothetical protein